MLLNAIFALYPCMILAIGRPRLLVIAPMGLLCLAILIATPLAASRGKLHLAGYIGIAIAAFVAAMVVGKLSGLHRINGTIIGLFLSVLFFLAISAALGSLIALAAYRHPPDPAD
jgi:hypothetical protein